MILFVKLYILLIMFELNNFNVVIGEVMYWTKRILKDTALENKGEDSFHHHDYVENIKQIIMEHNPPFNIALIGKWVWVNHPS